MAKRLVLPPGCSAGPALRQADSNERPLKSGSGTRQIGRLHESAFEHALRLAPGSLGALEIYLRSQIGHLGENHDSIRADLQEAAEDGELLLLIAPLEAQDSLAEKRDQWRMVRQNPELALASGHDDLVDITLEGSSLRSHDLQVEGHLPYSSTSCGLGP